MSRNSIKLTEKPVLYTQASINIFVHVPLIPSGRGGISSGNFARIRNSVPGHFQRELILTGINGLVELNISEIEYPAIIKPSYLVPLLIMGINVGYCMNK